MAKYEFSRQIITQIGVDVEKVRHDLLLKMLISQHLAHGSKFYQVDIVNIPWDWQRTYAFCAIEKRRIDEFYAVSFIEKDDQDKVIAIRIGVAQQLPEHESRMLLVDNKRAQIEIYVNAHDRDLLQLANDCVHRVIPIENVEVEDLETPIELRSNPAEGLSEKIDLNSLPANVLIDDIEETPPIISEPIDEKELPSKFEMDMSILSHVAENTLPFLPLPGQTTIAPSLSIDTEIEEAPVKADEADERMRIRFIINDIPSPTATLSNEEIHAIRLTALLEPTTSNKSLCTALSKGRILTIGDVLKRTPEKILSIPRCGVKGVAKIQEQLKLKYNIDW